MGTAIGLAVMGLMCFGVIGLLLALDFFKEKWPKLYERYFIATTTILFLATLAQPWVSVMSPVWLGILFLIFVIFPTVHGLFPMEYAFRADD